MELTHYGAACVLVASKHLHILIDPPDVASGLKLPKLKAEVELTTTLGENGFSHKDIFKIASPGEYEIKTVEIQGIGAKLHIDDPKAPAKGIMYTIGTAGLRLLVTGNISGQLSEAQIENIGEVNVMIVPIGGHGLTLDANAAAKLVAQFEPQWVVPVHYNDGKTKYPMPQDDLKLFLKEVGGEGVKPIPKLKVSARELGDETSVVVLEPQTK